MKNYFKEHIYNNPFIEEFFKYYSILNNINNVTLTIPIVLASDDKYLPFMYTTMISILENGNKNTYYIFYLLVPFNFSQINKTKINEINNNYKCFIYFIHIPNIFDNIIMKIPHITLTTYFRLLIGDYLPKKIEKCIYLDVDIIVTKDLSELFLIEMKDNYLAGVVAAGYYFKEKQNCKRLKLPSMKQYVNAGMLVMNVKQIRKDNLTKKFIELSKRNYSSQDQDVLNIVCFGKILTLPPKYNAMVFRLIENSPLLRDLYKEEDIIEARESPYIIHYSDKNKPWNSIGIFKENNWWDIAKKIPYIDSLFNRENIYKEELKKIILKKKKSSFDKLIYFNKKIQRLNLYESSPIKVRKGDKYLEREWISEKIGGKYLIPLIGVYNKFEDIDFEKLPNKFVIKSNHGNNYNIIVRNKSQLNYTKIKTNIEKSMNINYSYHNLELHFKDTKPKIIIEEYVDNAAGNLNYFKILCFNGKPTFIWAKSDKYSNNETYLYELIEEQLSYKVNLNNMIFHHPKKTKLLKNLLRLASKLSKNIDYIRVDFYVINEKIYYVGMTSSFLFEQKL